MAGSRGLLGHFLNVHRVDGRSAVRVATLSFEISSIYDKNRFGPSAVRVDRMAHKKSFPRKRVQLALHLELGFRVRPVQYTLTKN